jgi:hypothetical protein
MFAERLGLLEDEEWGTRGKGSPLKKGICFELRIHEMEKLELRLQWSSENIRRSLFCDRTNYEGRGSSQLHSPNNITNDNDQVTKTRWREKLKWVIEAGMR